MYLLGFDIGGTKCAVTTALWENEKITLLKKSSCPTDKSISPDKMIEKHIALADEILEGKPDRIGVSCGGPLDSKNGIILNPPNLQGWISVKITEKLESYYHAPTKLQNDANACAVAEWKFGAGRGKSNLVFMTFGTGLGAGLILDGKLYCGTNDNAGEVGHIRLDRFGPVGFGKSGSFEGFCSGGGIAQLGYMKAIEMAQSGKYPLYFKEGMTQTDVSAKSIADAADKGDPTAIEVYALCGKQLGRGLSVIIDILNPEAIIIGSIFTRSRHLLWEYAKKEIEKEALPLAADCCEVLSAELGENIGDYAAIATAIL